MKPEKADRFLEHLEPLQGPLEGYCRRSLLSAEAVPDVLQNAVANAYRDFHLYAEGTNFRAWIFCYVHHEIQNANRGLRRDRHEALPAELPGAESSHLPANLALHRLLLDDPDEVLEQCDAMLAEKIRALKPVERAVLLLHAIGEFKYSEIAHILQIPIGSVMSSLSRCRSRLRQELAEFGREKGLLKDVQP